MLLVNSNSKLVCIKLAKSRAGHKYWFWHSGKGGICGRQGTNKPFQFPAGATTIPVYNSDVHDTNRELQVGDTVFMIPTKSFGTIFLDNTPQYGVFTHINTSVYLNSDSLMFVSSSIASFKQASTVDINLCGAQQQSELDFYEKFTALKALFTISNNLPHIKIGEKAMLMIHKLIFSEIYVWGGTYRPLGCELVVGKNEGATLGSTKVKSALKCFFKNFNGLLSKASKNKSSMVTALVKLNVELCWIHPFVDGNGRTIRLLSEIIASEWGYILDWDMMKNKSKKKAYHYGIRRALCTKNPSEKSISKFFDKAIKLSE